MASQDEPDSDYEIGDIVEFVDEELQWRALILADVVETDGWLMTNVLLLKGFEDVGDEPPRILCKVNVRNTKVIARIKV